MGANISLAGKNWSLAEENISLAEAKISLAEANISLAEANISRVEENISLAETKFSLVEVNISLANQALIWRRQKIVWLNEYMNIALRHFLHNHGNIGTEGSTNPGLCPTLISMTSIFFYSAQYHRQHCTPQAFEQFGALYMHNPDDKYSAPPGFEPGTSRLQAPVDKNEPSGPA